MRVLGMNASGPNTSACLVVDGEVVAFVEEERFTRVKLASDQIPTSAAGYCLSQGKLDLSQLDAIAIGWGHHKYPEVMRRFYEERMSHPDKDDYSRSYETMSLMGKDPAFYGKRLEMAFAKKCRGAFPPVRYLPHHLCHAWSVYQPSPFDKSLIFVIDGSGEEMATSIWIGEGDEIRFVKSWDLPDSLGYFYAALTEYIGFKVFTGEGKVMGLAPYGEPDRELRAKLEQVMWIEGDGYKVDPSYIYFAPRTHSLRHTDKLTELLGRPPRVPESKFEPWHHRLAWETQDALERTVAHIITTAIETHGIRDVCIAGGVAMNCKMNGLISTLPAVDRCFVIPASNDAGVAVGSALLASKGVKGLRERARRFSAYSGPEYTDEHFLARLKEFKVTDYRRYSDAELFPYVAGRLAEGAIVGWFQGRMEVGARALGNRSILANPAYPEMKDKINAEVKHREAFRPFAPSVLAERAHELFQVKQTQTFEPYHTWMLQAAQALPGVAQKMPAIVHVDNSIRPQVVSAAANPRYHRLLSAFYAKTGVCALLNTSFNVRGEPIICNPDEALRCFFSTGLDMLVVGNVVLEKKR